MKETISNDWMYQISVHISAQ